MLDTREHAFWVKLTILTHQCLGQYDRDITDVSPPFKRTMRESLTRDYPPKLYYNTGEPSILAHIRHSKTDAPSRLFVHPFTTEHRTLTSALQSSIPLRT